MSGCAIHDSGSIELYFYGELAAAERTAIAAHLRDCRVCAAAHEELTVIREALAARPEIAAPPAGDWSGFMVRLDASLRAEPREAVVASFEAARARRQPLRGLLATAALLAIVSASVFFAWRGSRPADAPASSDPARIVQKPPADVAPVQAGMASVGARHLERSKLVVLGLATREPAAADDWAYERELATSLLNDTRLYRMAAEQRGLTSLAGVMRDLELVLLQTSMAEATDRTALPQIQRLIRKRGLVEKMDVVGTTGLVP